jgi:hypothetical protein
MSLEQQKRKVRPRNNLDNLKTFNLGTTPTLILSPSGVDEVSAIRPLQFFSYDNDNYGLLYLAADDADSSTRIIKLATSLKSGFNHVWTKQGLVLSGGGSGDWDYRIGSANVVKNDDTWILIYETFNTGVVGLATGTDLLSLTKHVSNPVMDNSASVGAFNRYLRHVNANIIGNTLYCHYEGRKDFVQPILNSNIGYATAPLSDLTDWTIHAEELVSADNISYATGNNSAVVNANIIAVDGYYYLWFQGYAPQNAGTPFELGGTSYAYSTDLINWTIVGTENYHVPTTLFGFNSSNDFYSTFQETTPVWDGQNMSLYMWDTTNTGIGKTELNGDVFVNIYRGFEMSDNFNDGSVDTNKWTVGTGNGITVSEAGGSLSIVCDGVGSELGDPIMLESKTTLNNDDVGSIICYFQFDRSAPTTGDLFALELSSSDRSNGIRMERSTTANKIDLKIIENNVVTDTTTVNYFGGSEKYKIVIWGRTHVDLFRGVGAYFSIQDTWNIASFTNIDWTFKVIANNSTGQTIDLEMFALGLYDNGKSSTFQT